MGLYEITDTGLEERQVHSFSSLGIKERDDLQRLMRLLLLRARRDAGQRRARVVRVGMHALVEGSGTTLWGRLRRHRRSVGGRNPGGGSHRTSFFRLHVRTALLGSDPSLDNDPARQSWGQGNSAPSDIKARERSVEARVSGYIGEMPFLWLAVDDPPGKKSDRGVIEASSIALLSTLANGAADRPSDTWLCRHANRDAVRLSGMWNVNHVNGTVDPRFLDRLDHWIERTPT